jgi:hypothetical protein
VRSGQIALRRLNASRRLEPSYLIIGAAKAGTTSLHDLLCEHPRVLPPTEKEIHYFDFHYGRGPGWYRAHFATKAGPEEIAGEATPYYLFHPAVPERVAADIPDARLIALLRDPIDRALSHHNHESASGYETLSFEEALDAEPGRLEGEEARILADPGYRSFPHQHHSYLARGRYAQQLGRWLEQVDREQILILSAEELFEEPARTLETAQRFLDLEPATPRDLRARNARSYSPMPEDLRDRLRAEFAEENKRVYELAGRDFGWG